MNKRLISMILTLAMLFGLLPTVTLPAAAATGDLPTAMWVMPSETNDIPVRIDVFVSDQKTTQSGGSSGGGGCGGGSSQPKTTTTTYTCDLYLPGNVNPGSCFLCWDNGRQTDNTNYVSGACPAPAVGETAIYTFTKGDTIAVFEVTTHRGSAAVLPIFIDIDESQGTIAAMDNDANHETKCTGAIYIDGQRYEMPTIKGRGNYTWSQAKDKKAYNITLDSKITIRGIDAEKTKKWSILAEIGDHSLLCNRTGFRLAHEIGVGQDTASADVWMNGEYQGCYTVTPKYDSFVTKNGYLIEEDNYLETVSVEDGGDPQFELEGMHGGGTDTSHYNLITVKKIGDNLLLNDAGEVDESAQSINAATEEIRVWLQDAWDAIRSEDGYNSQGKYYTDYIDIESFARMYLMHEYVKSYDVCAGSILFHRDGQGENDKLIAGPVWDLDNAMGSTQANNGLGSVRDRSSGAGTFITEINEDNYKTSLYKTLYVNHEDFQQEVFRQYNKYCDAFENMPDDVEQMVSEIRDSAMMNHVKVTELSYNLHKYSNAKTLESGTVYQQNMLATKNSKTDWPNYAANLKSYVTARSLWFSNTYKEYYAAFDVLTDATITAFDTQDMTAGGHENVDKAYARDGVTGELDKTGHGQVSFIVNAAGVYNIGVEPGNYFEALQGPDETGIPNGYRITGITGPVTVTVEGCRHEFADGVCSVCGLAAPRVTFDCSEGVSIHVARTQDAGSEIFENVTVAFPRDDSGELDISGEGQVNFVVNVADGYRLDSVTAAPSASYKNLKQTDIENGYRLTKIKADLTVNVQASCIHEYTETTVPPKCTEAGYTLYTCTRCGDTYTDLPEAALGHEWSDWAVTAEPTCTEAGVETRTCGRCGEAETRQIEALGHAYTYTPIDADSHEVGCSRCGLSQTEAHAYADGVCACGMKPNGAIKDPDLKIKTASISLESDLTINFYVADTVLDLLEDPYLVFTKARYDAEGNITGYDTLEPVRDSTPKESSAVACHVYKFRGINAMEMGSEVTATLYGTIDGQLYEGKTVTYSVLTYATNQLRKTQDEKLKTLLVDLLNYGAKAQIYWNYNTANLVTANLTPEQQACGTAQNPELESCRELIINDGASVSFKTCSLSLEEKVTINYYLNLDSYSGEVADLELHVTYRDTDGTEETAVIDSAEFQYKMNNNDGRYYYVANLSRLNALQMRTVCTAEVYSKTSGKRISDTAIYSIESYAYSMSTAGSEPLSDLVYAMMKYGDAAKAFFTQS